MRDAGSFRGCNGTNGEASPSMTKLNDHLNFSAGASSCSRRLPQIAEIGNEITSPADQSLENANGSNQHFVPKFTSDSWDESAFNSLRRARDNEGNMFPTSNALETQVKLAELIVILSAFCLAVHLLILMICSFNRMLILETDPVV